MVEVHKIIYEGTNTAILQGLIDVEPNTALSEILDDLGIVLEDGQLLIHRKLHRNGRNVIRVNNTLVNAQL